MPGVARGVPRPYARARLLSLVAGSSRERTFTSRTLRAFHAAAEGLVSDAATGSEGTGPILTFVLFSLSSELPHPTAFGEAMAAAAEWLGGAHPDGAATGVHPASLSLDRARSRADARVLLARAARCGGLNCYLIDG